MRWNATLTTLATYTFDITDTSNYANKDPKTLLVTWYSNRQYQTGPEIEFRFYPLKEAAALYLYQRDGVFGWFGHGNGATDGVSYYVAAGASGAWATRSTSMVACNTTACTACCRAARPGPPAYWPAPRFRGSRPGCT